MCEVEQRYKFLCGKGISVHEHPRLSPGKPKPRGCGPIFGKTSRHGRVRCQQVESVIRALGRALIAGSSSGSAYGVVVTTGVVVACCGVAESADGARPSATPTPTAFLTNSRLLIPVIIEIKGTGRCPRRHSGDTEYPPSRRLASRITAGTSLRKEKSIHTTMGRTLMLSTTIRPNVVSEET